MQREQIVFVGTSDLSGHFRGKSFPLVDLTSRLERGVVSRPPTYSFPRSAPFR
jgi:hypothetical protein